MSSVGLLKVIPFARAHSCEVGVVEHSTIKSEINPQAKPDNIENTSRRSIIFTFKFGFPIIVQVQ